MKIIYSMRKKDSIIVDMYVQSSSGQFAHATAKVDKETGKMMSLRAYHRLIDEYHVFSDLFGYDKHNIIVNADIRIKGSEAFVPDMVKNATGNDAWKNVFGKIENAIYRNYLLYYGNYSDKGKDGNDLKGIL